MMSAFSKNCAKHNTAKIRRSPFRQNCVPKATQKTTPCLRKRIQAFETAIRPGFRQSASLLTWIFLFFHFLFLAEIKQAEDATPRLFAISDSREHAVSIQNVPFLYVLF